MTHEEILSMLGDYVDYLIANSSAEAPMWNIEKVRSGKPNKWNYIDGCMITACLSLYKTTGDEKYSEIFQGFHRLLRAGGRLHQDLRPEGVQPRQRESGQEPVHPLRHLRRREVPQGHRHHPQPAAHPAPHQGGQLLAQGHLPVAGLAGRHLHGPALLHGVRDPLQQDAGLHRQLQAVHEHQKAHAGREDRPVLPRLR